MTRTSPCASWFVILSFSLLDCGMKQVGNEEGSKESNAELRRALSVTAARVVREQLGGDFSNCVWTELLRIE